MKCTYRFSMYAVHALPIRPPCAIELRWPQRVQGMYVVHTPLAPWIRNGQVLIRDIICSGIAINAPYAPHVRHPCAIDAQLIRNTCEIVAPQMFHQTTSAILLRICPFFSYPVRAPWHHRPVEQGHYQTYMMKLTCCTWDCLLEPGAHSRHITQIGMYFILINNWDIYVLWNISKILYWMFFLFNTWFRYWIVWYFV